MPIKESKNQEGQRRENATNQGIDSGQKKYENGPEAESTLGHPSGHNGKAEELLEPGLLGARSRGFQRRHCLEKVGVVFSSLPFLIPYFSHS